MLTDEKVEQLAESVGMLIDKYGLARDAKTGLEDGVDIHAFARAIEAEATSPLLARIAGLETLIAEILVDVAAYEKRSGAKVSGWPDKARAAMKEQP